MSEAGNGGIGGAGGVGSIGEEAAKLVEAVHEWARRSLGDPATAHIATGAAECSYCPVCQLIAVLRGDRPEVTARLADVGSAVVTALRAALDGMPDGTNPPPAQQQRVQHIDLDDPPE